MIDFGCEICYDWNRRLNITRQWWKSFEDDWRALNGKDLPCFVAILSVLRELTLEIYNTKSPTSKNHSKMQTDSFGYGLVFNKNCQFTPLSEVQKEKWRVFFRTIKIFRNGAAHLKEVHPMNPYLRDPENPLDSMQDYYRFALFPDLKPLKKNNGYDELKLQEIHKLIRDTILKDVRSNSSNIPNHRILYEFCHIERGLLVNLFHEKLDLILKEIKALAIPPLD